MRPMAPSGGSGGNEQREEWRQLLIRSRAVLRTCYHEKPEELSNGARRRVLAKLMEDITEALGQ